MTMNREKMIEILEEYHKTDTFYITKKLPYIIAVDFDHTLCYSEYPNCGIASPVVDFIKSIKDLPIKFILTTCRERESLKIALEWCQEQGLQFDYINENDPNKIKQFGDCRKIFCNMLIDDTCYNFNMNDFKKGV